MNHPYLLVAGCSIVGWVLPEILVAGRARVPVGVNVVGAIAGTLISAAFVL